MGFFYNDQREVKPKRDLAPAKARLEDIPVAILRKQSCAVCPRAKDDSLQSPKMRPEGPQDAPVYLLGGSPSTEDDKRDKHWQDDAMGVVADFFGQSFMRDQVRSNYVVQCRGDEHVVVTECCRGRIEQDIEDTKPAIVVVVGDSAFRWATGLTDTALKMRGLTFSARFGKHTCMVYVLLYPNFAYKQRSSRPSKYEHALRHDILWIKRNYDRLPPVDYFAPPYDTGIELLTGDQPGDIHRLEKRLREIARYEHQGLDIETTGLRPYMLRHPHILTAAVGTFEDTLAFPLEISSAGHPEGWGTTAREQRAKELFAEWLQFSGRKACHNLAMEMEWIEHDFGGEVLRRTEWDDTMAMAYAMDGRSGIKSLDVQTRIRCGFQLKDQSPVNVRLEQWWLKYSLKQILRYNGMDTKWTDWLRRDGEARMDDQERAIYLQRVRLAPTLVHTEAPGLMIDLDYAAKLDDEMSSKAHDIERRIYTCKEIRDYQRKFGKFEPTNTDHVLRLMKDLLHREECKREERDGRIVHTTDEEALSAIPSSEVPSAPLILEHREVKKLHGTYVLPALQKKWVCRDGLVRTKYSSMIAVTGRLAAEDPNVTNWPKRKHREVRGMVRAKRGRDGKRRWLVPVDYGQIEFRVIGMASHDKNLVRYCWTNYDVHKFWAQRAIKEYPSIQDWVLSEFHDTLAVMRKKAGKDYDEDAAILKTLRQEMKNRWVFPLFFGSQVSSCALALHMPDDIANDLADEFWDEFRGVKKWQEGLVRFYEKHLYVETLGGLRRRGIMTLNELINHPVQGTAAQIVQESHIVLSERADIEGDPELQPIINVHDDLTFDIGDDTLEQKIEVIAREMCMHRFDYINVPLIVEVSVGERWDNTQEIKVYRSDELYGLKNPYAKERA